MAIGTYKNLLKSFGFQSFLWTQFLGAFNDNVFKIVLSMIAVNLAGGGSGGGWYVSLVGAVFILPFFLFSGYAGFLADVYNKRPVLIITKSFEIIAVTFGLFAFLSGRIEFMLITLFLMALHSTFFGPAKYGIIPEMLPEKELSRANGLLEMSTFLAIILGTSAGAIMYSGLKDRLGLIGVFLLVIAFAGTFVSFGIPRVPGSGASKRFNMNPWSEIASGFKRLRQSRLLFLTVSAITYFWFLGSLLQMDILLLGKEVMGLNDLWIGILITFLAVGIGAGSITAGRMSGDKVEPGLVPLGSIGMGLFSILLGVSYGSYPKTAAALIMIGFSGGLFIVPLNALLQHKSGNDEKGRLIATNNFVNTAGILLASCVLWILRDKFNVQADRIILWFGVLTLICTVFLMKALPEFFTRLVLWMLTHTLYKIRIVGEENVPFRGPALFVCNHMSFVDGLLVGACVHRFIRFMVYQYFYKIKSVNWLLSIMKAIPVADANRREILESISRARDELIAGHVVCIFAEGEISRTGNLLPFKKGFERIVDGLDIPVIPVHLDRVWGSVFSFKNGLFFWKFPARFPYPVTVSFGKPLSSGATALEVRQAVMELGSHAAEYRRAANDLLHFKFIKAAKRRPLSFCMADSTGKELTYGRALAGSLALSGWLRRSRPDDKIIAVALPSSVAGALANLAILFSGKIPVNVNFTSSAQAMASAIGQCGIKTVLTSRLFLSKAKIDEMKGMVFLEDIVSGISGLKKFLAFASTLVLPSRLLEIVYCRGKKNTNDVAAIIFTTGSTGAAKGVMLTHHNILSNVEALQQIFPLTPKDRLMGVLPFFHSFGFTGTIWFPLLSGFGAAYHSNPLDARTIGEMVRKYGATIIIGTPTFYHGYVKRCTKEEFSSLRYAIAGAEKLRRPLAEEFKEKFGIDLLEGYGCTEMSPVVSVNIPDVEHQKQRQTGYKPGTVGHPIPGVSVKVVDHDGLHQLPPGKEGLLLVKGPNLMAGYYKDPVKTREALHDGWYVTGDIASIGEDGFIRIIDRVSRFSKMGGEMVPHVKIEDTISEITGGGACAVTSVPDEQKGERLVAFYTDKDMTPAVLWERLTKTDLPRLWIPKRDDLFYMEEIPATATGKTDIGKVKKLAMEMAVA